ncbi:MAG: hypothetical protein Q9192_008654 [Flavoplaca navasiana]
MAAAGFYHKPAASTDYVTCFHCDLQLDGWSDDDKPFLEHAKRSKDCSWVKKVCPEPSVLTPIEKPAPKQPESPPATPPPTYSCRRCHEAFPTNNQLHRHIRSTRHFDQSSSAKSTPPATPVLPSSPLKTPPAQKPASQQRPRYYKEPMGHREGSQYYNTASMYGAGAWNGQYQEARQPSRPPAS